MKLSSAHRDVGDRASASAPRQREREFSSSIYGSWRLHSDRGSYVGRPPGRTCSRNTAETERDRQEETDQ